MVDFLLSCTNAQKELYFTFTGISIEGAVYISISKGMEVIHMMGKMLSGDLFCILTVIVLILLRLFL